MGERIAVFCPVVSYLKEVENHWTRSPKALIHVTRPVLTEVHIEQLFECKHLEVSVLRSHTYSMFIFSSLSTLQTISTPYAEYIIINLLLSVSVSITTVLFKFSSKINECTRWRKVIFHQLGNWRPGRIKPMLLTVHVQFFFNELLPTPPSKKNCRKTNKINQPKKPPYLLGAGNCNLPYSYLFWKGSTIVLGFFKHLCMRMCRELNC